MSDVYLRIAGHLIAINGNNANEIVNNPQFVNFKAKAGLTEHIINISGKYRPILGIIEFYTQIEDDICVKMYRLSSSEFCMNMIDIRYDKRVSLYFNTKTKECIIGGNLNTRFHSYIILVAYSLLVADKDTFLIKSFSVICDSRSVLFLSNYEDELEDHINLWNKNIIGIEQYCHNYSIVKIEQRGVFVFSSPWSNSNKSKCHNEVELKAIVKYNSKKTNNFERLTIAKAISAFYPFSSPILDFEKKSSSIVGRFITAIFRRIPIYKVECKQDPESIQHVYEIVLGDNIYYE